jgi:hypothetical protein
VEDEHVSRSADDRDPKAGQHLESIQLHVIITLRQAKFLQSLARGPGLILS